MKNLYTLLLAAAVALSLAACGQNAQPATSAPQEAAQEERTGAWHRAASPEVPDTVRALLAQALDGLVGASYTPVAYLGSQVVAGTNHKLLCRTAPAVPDPVETYAIVTLYADLDGNAELTEIQNTSAATRLSAEPLDGGWAQPDSPAVTDAARAVFDKALEDFTGVQYVPVALLSTQVVAGMNYCFLCEATVVYPGAETGYALVYVYEDLDGNAAVTEIADLEDASAENGASAQIANPFADCGSLEEAAAAAGFDMTAPDAVDGYSDRRIQVMNNEMIQLIYSDGDSRLLLRKAAGSEDISGDYNAYAETRTLAVGDASVTMKGGEGMVRLAIWTDKGYAYAVASDEPMPVEAMTALVSQIA